MFFFSLRSCPLLSWLPWCSTPVPFNSFLNTYPAFLVLFVGKLLWYKLAPCSQSWESFSKPIQSTPRQGQTPIVILRCEEISFCIIAPECCLLSYAKGIFESGIVSWTFPTSIPVKIYNDCDGFHPDMFRRDCACPTHREPINLINSVIGIWIKRCLTTSGGGNNLMITKSARLNLCLLAPWILAKVPWKTNVIILYVRIGSIGIHGHDSLSPFKSRNNS